ncbi:MAG: MATE family efflux transporter, partial [Spirochaetales bacterium]|nr:MATE family efflux transporter [Candidatus Physcosoma equi]
FNTIQNLLLALFIAFGTGGAVVISQLLGMGNKERASFAAKQLIYLTTFVSVVLAGVFLLIRNPLLHLVYGTIEMEVFENASLYAIPILLSLPFLAGMNSLNALFRAMGRTKISMQVSIFSNIVNIVGNALCILVFHMGALGVGIATLASRVVSVIILMAKISDKSLPVHVEGLQHFKLDGKMIGTIFSIALPSGLENSIWHVGKIVMISTIAYFGTASIASFAVLDNIGTFANITGQAWGLTLMTLAGQCCGAKKYDQARFYTRQMLLAAYISMAIVALFLLLFMPYIVGIYGYGEETTKLAIFVCTEYMFFNVVFWPASFTPPNLLKAAGDVNYTMVSAISSMWFFRVFFARFLGITMNMGLGGVLWGMYIDWIVRSILFFARYKSGKWESKGIERREGR